VVGGQLTYDRFESLKAFVKKAPLNSLLLETDAPWLTPNLRKKKMKEVVNKPAYLVDVLEELAKVLKMDTTALEEAVLQNTLRLFPQFKEAVESEGYSRGEVKPIAQLGADVIRQVESEIE